MLPFYLGGFLGPFGTMIILPMFPELREHFGVSSSVISWGFSAYLFPMAALLLVSGTIGERFGRRRVLRICFLTYVVTNLATAAAPNLAVFLAGRALGGAANAFITPLLIAGLAEVTEESHLGRRVGVYTSFQAAGGGAAPFVGGLAAAYNWRLAFVMTALVAALLALVPPPGKGRSGTARPPIRPLLSRRMLALAVASLTGAAGPLGIAVLVGFKIRDELGMSAATAGLLLAGGSLGGTLAGPFAGRLLDRKGMRWSSIVGGATLSTLGVVLGFTTNVASTAATFVLLGSTVTLLIAVLQKAGASAVPENRGGALSAVLSFRFAGHALGPVLWVPVFNRSVPAAFVGASALGIVTVAAFLFALPRSERRSTDPGGGGRTGVDQ